MVITYEVGDGLYVNVTNRCTNSCSFCVRSVADGTYGELWLDREPTVEEIVDSIVNADPTKYSEIVFCGYGEPTLRFYDIILVSTQVKAKFPGVKIRINTNGHANLIHKQDVSDVVADSCDVVNVSLNAPNKERYQQICNCIYGEEGYDAMLEFAKLCKQRGAKVVLSVVDVLSPKEVDECKKIASKMGVEFRLREKE